MISFNEEGHKYLKDGLILIPSVSELVKFATGENYDGIPQFVLEKAAQFGTSIHDAIQDYLINNVVPTFFDEKLSNAWDNFMALKDEHILPNYRCEEIISYKDMFAGRFDLLANKTLIDFKTNSKYDERLNTHLEWQLGFYKLAMASMGYEIEDCYCLYLPKKGKGKWVEIKPIEEEKLLEVINEYGTQKSLGD